MRDAILLGQTDTVQLFLAAGVNPNDKAFEGETKYTERLIHFAAKSSNLEMVRLLIENGAKFCYNKRDDRDDWNENYGLRTAVIEGKQPIVDYLLGLGSPAS